MRLGRRTTAAVALAGVIALVLLAWATLTVVGVEPWDNEGPRDALICAFALALALAGAAAVLAARHARAGGHAAAQRSRADAEALAAAERERDRSAEQAVTAREDAERWSQRAARSIARLEHEREWGRELRSQVVAMHHARGAFGRGDDVRELVLRVALQLTEAPKGLLLAAADADRDGRLDVVAAQGFDEDARQSEVAQRFAERVIEQDVVIREETVPGTTAAVDDEISTLIAIPITMADDFRGVVICADRPGGFDACEDDVLLSLGDHAGAVLQNAALHGRLREAFVATVQLLTDAVQAKDPFLRGHSEDVADYVEAVSDGLGVAGREREQLGFASLLHDVGKLGISERILLKPGRLSPEERAVVELHPRIGFRLVEQVPGMQEIAPLVLHHHERWDGAGYPAGLRGDEIPLGARVIGVADAFSAMTEQRPYRGRMSAAEACAELERCAGSQFDPRVVGLFVAEVRDHPRPTRRGPLAEALGDAELEVRRQLGEGVLGAGTATLTDSLTLLYSRRYFHEVAAAEAERAELQGRPFAVVVCDLGGLADRNLREGWASGDELLRSSARELAHVAVLHGAVACRVGGNRLGLLVTGADDAAAAAVAVQVEAALPNAGVRLGWGCWRSGLTGEAVIAQARLALATPVRPRG